MATPAYLLCNGKALGRLGSAADHPRVTTAGLYMSESREDLPFGPVLLHRWVKLGMSSFLRLRAICIRIFDLSVLCLQG